MSRWNEQAGLAGNRSAQGELSGRGVGKANYMGIEVVEGEEGPATICPRSESSATLRFRPSAAEAALERRESLVSASTLNHEQLLSSRTVANASTSL